jgi:hypothetical protein
MHPALSQILAEMRIEMLRARPSLTASCAQQHVVQSEAPGPKGSSLRCFRRRKEPLMRRVLRQIRQRATSKPLEDTNCSRKRHRYPSDLSWLLDGIDRLIGSSRIPTDPGEIR